MGVVKNLNLFWRQCGHPVIRSCHLIACNLLYFSAKIKPMNVIILNKEDPVVAAAVEGCEVGVPQSFTITFTPTVDTDTQLVADVDPASISYVDGGEVEPTEEEVPVEDTEEAYRPAMA